MLHFAFLLWPRVGGPTLALHVVEMLSRFYCVSNANGTRVGCCPKGKTCYPPESTEGGETMGTVDAA